MDSDATRLLDIWFGDDLDTPAALAERSGLWFASNPSFDERLREEFEKFPDRAIHGDFDAWRENPRTTVALVLALDQLPRNLFRDSARGFAYDAAAVEVTQRAIDQDLDAGLHPVEATFLYLPLEHAEDAALQAQCVELFRKLLDRASRDLREPVASFLSFAERHQEVIQRFGRFPHRNHVLGRQSTPEETRYLAEGGERFGGEDDEN